MPLRKVHELAFLWFGLPGPLLILSVTYETTVDIESWAKSSGESSEASATLRLLSIELRKLLPATGVIWVMIWVLRAQSAQKSSK